MDQYFADIAFLALVIWREARGEIREAKIAVAWVIMNRVAHPSWMGRDVMSVVFKKWQFSSVTDPNDPQLTKWPETADPSWIECLAIAHGVIDGQIPNPIAGADGYYDISIPAPAWAEKKMFVKQIGRLRFYDLYFRNPR